METLILSCGTGGGHNAAGEAVAEELKKRGHHVELLNPYDLKNPKLAAVIDKIYIKMVQRIPELFGIIYRIGDLYRRLPFRSPVYFANRKMAGLVEEYIDEHSFDAIVVPHLYAAEILTGIKAQGKHLPPVFFLATDYTCIPFTEETDCDYVVIPSDDLTEEFADRGIEREKLYPLGIPVKSAFCSGLSRRKAKEEVGLSAEKHYILVVGGSVGAGKIPLIVKLLFRHFKNKNAELVVICGNNEHLYQELKKEYGKRIILIRHTDCMAAYMRACELIISKPGGLSSTEAAVSGTALIHITPIPGCESRNMSYFASRNMSVPVWRVEKELLPACKKLLHREAREKMIRCQWANINRNVTGDICNLIEEVTGKKAEPKSGR